MNPLNDHKPVSNSRDCQEVPYEEGMMILEIYRDFNEQTSIIDDFPTFEKEEQKR